MPVIPPVSNNKHKDITLQKLPTQRTIATLFKKELGTRKNSNPLFERESDIFDFVDEMTRQKKIRNHQKAKRVAIKKNNEEEDERQKILVINLDF